MDKFYPAAPRDDFARMGQIDVSAADGPIWLGSDQPGAQAPGSGRGP
jgi:hypothetical protein